MKRKNRNIKHKRGHPGMATGLLLLLVLPACQGSLLAPFLPATSTLTPTLTATATQTATASITPTATQTHTPTLTPTATLTPTSVDPWGSYKPPTLQAATEIPREMARIPEPEDAVHVILLGSDYRPGSGFRTDTMMIVSFFPEEGRAVLLSLPRDLYVYLPGYGMGRINTAQPRGGFEMTADTIRYNFGIDLDYYMLVEFWGFEEAVNRLGGLHVRSTGWLGDECAGTFYSYGPDTTYFMDGTDALCYARMRKRSSDFDRTRRQQELMAAFFDRVLSIDGLEKVPELYEVYQHTFKTNMTLEAVLELVPLASRLALDPDLIERYQVDHTMVQGWRVPVSGAAVQLPDREAIQVLLELVYPAETE